MIEHHMIKHLIFAKNSKYDGYQSEIVSMVYEFFDKKNSGDAPTLGRKSAVKNKNTSSKEIAEELNKIITGEFKKRKVHSPFIDNILGTDLAYKQLISRFN